MTVDFNQLILVFFSIVLEALPFVVLGVVIAGLLEEFVPQQVISGLFHGQGLPVALQKTLPRPVAVVVRGLLSTLRVRVIAIGLGGVLGLVFPMCECGIIPVMRRLMRKGVPLSVCVCYMLAGPIINVVVMLSTYVAFSPRTPDAYLFALFVSDGSVTFTHPPASGDYWFAGALTVVGLRVGLGFVIAFLTSLLVEWQYRRHGSRLLTPMLVPANGQGEDEESGGAAPARHMGRRIGNVAETSLHDFIDIMAFLVLGACLAAVGRTFLPQAQVEQLFQDSPAVAILLMMAIAVVFCLCSEADAFVAANFPAVWPPASKIAFLVLGPMLDFKLYLMYTRVFRQRLIWTIILSVVTQVFLYTLLLHYLWPDNGFSAEFLKLAEQAKR